MCIVGQRLLQNGDHGLMLFSVISIVFCPHDLTVAFGLFAVNFLWVFNLRGSAW